MMHWFYLRQDVAILSWQIQMRSAGLFCPRFYKDVIGNWADDKQSKTRNSDSKYRQIVGFDT